MRPLILSLGGYALVLSAVWAQTASKDSSAPQLPVGQVYKDFQFPLYQQGELKGTLSAVEAKGVTLNRAETSDLKIELYEDGKVTTTITSPMADLYIADRKMRTKNTVKIDRADMVATSQSCDFDLLGKKYLMRDKVRVVLKHFDANPTPAGTKSRPPMTTPLGPSASSSPVLPPKTEAPLPPEGVLDMPGAYGNTNVAPIPRNP